MIERDFLWRLLPTVMYACAASLVLQGSARGQEVTAIQQGTKSVQKLPHSGAGSTLLWLTDIRDVFDAYVASALIGTRISVRDIRIEDADGDRFWIVSADQKTRIRVIAAERGLVTVRPGAIVSVQGEFRRAAPVRQEEGESEVYVYAYVVRPAW